MEDVEDHGGGGSWRRIWRPINGEQFKVELGRTPNHHSLHSPYFGLGELSCHIMTCPSSLLPDLFPVVTFMERRFGARRYEQHWHFWSLDRCHRVNADFSLMIPLSFLNRYFPLVAAIPIIVSIFFQILWILTYDGNALQLIEECGADSCLEVVHVDTHTNAGVRFLYIFPLLCSIVTCPILAILTIRNTTKMAKSTGSYTERDRKETKQMIAINSFYIITFFLCFWPNIAEFFYDFTEPGCENGVDRPLYMLYFCQALLNPLHGFWNAFIFVWRPRLLRRRTHHQPLVNQTGFD